MASPAYQRERRSVAAALKALRAGANLSGTELAERAGWQQSKVSKIERLKQVPAEDDVVIWAQLTGATPEVLAGMLASLRGARVEYAAWKDAYGQDGASGVQQEILGLEAGSTRIAEFQPGFVSGLLQTRDYADEALHLACGPASYGRDEADIQETIAVRMQRHQALYDRSKQVQVIMPEGALWTRMVSVPVLAAQLDRLIDLAGLSTLELGIIPFEAAVPIWPLGFRLYDELVIVETLVGEQQLAEPENIARFGKYLELLRDSAAIGPAAVPVIRRALAGLDG